MGRTRGEPAHDPATGKALPEGITYRGPAQYRARKLANGRRITQTFTSARLAVRWLMELQVDSERGELVDRSARLYRKMRLIQLRRNGWNIDSFSMISRVSSRVSAIGPSGPKGDQRSRAKDQ